MFVEVIPVVQFGKFVQITAVPASVHDLRHHPRVAIENRGPRHAESEYRFDQFTLGVKEDREDLTIPLIADQPILIGPEQRKFSCGSSA